MLSRRPWGGDCPDSGRAVCGFLPTQSGGAGRCGAPLNYKRKDKNKEMNNEDLLCRLPERRYVSEFRAVRCYSIYHAFSWHLECG